MESVTTMQRPTCPGCGKARGEWTANNAKGFEVDGQRYCCRGCAVDTGCFCR
jgi:hypothetical protein